MSKTITKNKYNLNDFEHIKNHNDIPELNITSIKLINSISKKVGAPSYRKTPVFRKKNKIQNIIIPILQKLHLLLK